VYPDYYSRPVYTKDLDLRREVEKQDVIFLMITERFLHKFDWTFIDQLYDLYIPVWLKDPVYDNINKIMQTDSWYNEIISKAEKKHLSLEIALIEEGKFMYYRKDTIDYFINYGPEYFSRVISGDTAWMSHIREKAVNKNISAEEMLKLDAIYIFKQNYPGLFEMNQGLEATEKRIYIEPRTLDSLGREAAFYRWDRASYIRIKAWQIYNDQEIRKTCRVILNDPAWLESVRNKAIQKGIPLVQFICGSRD
jgi:hypothetical protein